MQCVAATYTSPKTETMSTTPTSILLLGAGELGTSILTALSSHPALRSTPITLAFRPSSLTDTTSPRLTHLCSLSPNLTFASLDLSSPNALDSLTSLIRSTEYSAVISATGFAGSGDASSSAQLTIAHAVLQAGCVRQYFPWQFGVDYDGIGPDVAGGLMAEQCAVRSLLRDKAEEAGVEWTILSTGMFTSFVFEEWFGVVEGLGPLLKDDGKIEEGQEIAFRALGSWENKVTLTDVDDIGRMVAELVVSPPEINDQGGSVVYMAGNTVTYQELADVTEWVIGQEVKREEWTVEYLAGELAKDEGDQIKKYRVLFGAGKGVSWDEEDTVNNERGIRTRGVEEWLREKVRGQNCFPCTIWR